MKLISLLCAQFFLLITPVHAGETVFQKAEAIRQQRPHFAGPESHQDSPQQQERLAQLRTRPKAKWGFRPYLTKLLTAKDSPLSAEQRTGFARLRDQYKAEQNRLHDEWNTIHMQHLMCGWRYARCTPQEAPALKAELEDWMRFYLRFQADFEFSLDRQSRELWALLTAEQQRAVTDLKWQTYARTAPGHPETFVALKKFQQAIGPLDEATSQRVAKEAAQWHARYLPLAQKAEAAHDDLDRLMFYYDAVDSALFAYAMPQKLQTHAELVRLEPEAIRALYQQLDPARREEWHHKADQAIGSLRKIMLNKYSTNARSLLLALGETPLTSQL